MNKLILKTYLSFQILDLARFGAWGISIISLVGVLSFTAMISIGEQVRYILEGLSGRYIIIVPEGLISSPEYLNIIIILLLGSLFVSIALENIFWGLSLIFTEIRCYLEIKGEAFELKKALNIFLDNFKRLYKRKALGLIPYYFFMDLPEILEGKTEKELEVEYGPKSKGIFFKSLIYIIIIFSISLIFYFNNIFTTILGIIGISMARSIAVIIKHISYRNKIHLKQYHDKNIEIDDTLYGFTVKW